MDSSPPLQELLVSIRSQASSLAVACVSHLLENQMSDPAKMATRIKHLGSAAVSRWNLQKEDAAAAGDTGLFKMTTEEKFCNIPLLNLPENVRNTIWSYLDDEDILSLRFVSKEVQEEMDHQFGLPVVMDTSSESFKLLREVTTRSCIVTHLQNLTYFNFLPHPENLHFLRIQRDVLLTTEQVDLIIRKFPQLKLFTFPNKNLVYHYIDDGRRMAVVLPTETRKLLDILRDRNNLFGVRIFYNSVGQAVDWELEFSHKERNLGRIQISIPHEEIRLQQDVMDFLEEQMQLFEIRSDVAGLEWGRYAIAIQNNSATLTGVHLNSLKCCVNDPFDCSILKQCVNLRCFTLTGENTFSNISPGGFPYIPVVETECLCSIKKLCMLYFGKVYFTKQEFDILNQKMRKNVYIRITSSSVEKQEITDIKLGAKIFELEEECVANWEKEKEEEFEAGKYDQLAEMVKVYEYDHDHNGHGQSTAQNGLKAFISETTQGFRSELIKGIIITAWIVIC